MSTMTVVGRAPEGYQIPRAAADLIAYAAESGWTAVAVWDADDTGHPFLSVTLHRNGILPGREFHYEVTWHSRGQEPGHMRVFDGSARTPWLPVEHEAPALHVIRTVIRMHSHRTVRKAA